MNGAISGAAAANTAVEIKSKYSFIHSNNTSKTFFFLILNFYDEIFFIFYFYEIFFYFYENFFIFYFYEIFLNFLN